MEFLNQVILKGRLSKTNDTKTSNNGTIFHNNMIEIEHGRGVSKIGFTAFGHPANSLHGLRAGTPLELQGSLSNKQDRNGAWGLQIYINDIFMQDDNQQPQYIQQQPQQPQQGHYNGTFNHDERAP